jgi:hypothetical protein
MPSGGVTSEVVDNEHGPLAEETRAEAVRASISIMRANLVLLFCSVVTVCVVGCSAGSSTELSSHSYIHNPSGQIHFVFDLRRCKRGIFFGSCGPSTRSLQWEYHIELKGPGPTYTREEIEIKDGDLHPVPVESGTIVTDAKRGTSTIAVNTSDGTASREFVGNGTYAVRRDP